MKHQAINLVKFKALSQRLRLPLYRTVGLLESLWVFCQIQARDGDLTRFTPLEISGWLEWDGDDEKALIDALVETGWLDWDGDSLRIHDWDTHKPNWLKGVDASPRTKKRTPSDKPSDSPSVDPSESPSETPGATPPNLTQPNLTKESATHSLSAGDRFKQIWNATAGVVAVRTLSESRLTTLRKRCGEMIPTDDGEMLWLDALEWASPRKFPLRFTRGSPRNWKPDTEWILRGDSLLKVCEGKYDWERGNVQPTDNSTAGNDGERGL